MFRSIVLFTFLLTTCAIAFEQVYPKDEKAVAAIASRSIPYVKEFLEFTPMQK